MIQTSQKSSFYILWFRPHNNLPSILYDSDLPIVFLRFLLWYVMQTSTIFLLIYMMQTSPQSSFYIIWYSPTNSLPSIYNADLPTVFLLYYIMQAFQQPSFYVIWCKTTFLPYTYVVWYWSSQKTGFLICNIMHISLYI